MRAEAGAAGGPWCLERLVLRGAEVSFVEGRELPGRWIARDAVTFKLPGDLPGGYYRLRPVDQEDYAFPLPVNGPDAEDAEIVLVRPVLTEWSYHHRGFFPSRVAGLGTLRRAMAAFARRLPGRGPRFPVRASIRLDAAYERNWTWDRTPWHATFGRLRGCWNDEILSAWPVHLMLAALGLRYKVYSDIDLHRGIVSPGRHSRLLLYGAEGLTRAAFEALAAAASQPDVRLILWACQGLGYREYGLSDDGRTLRHLATRGRRGLWGEPLGPSDPSWDEGQAFGFRFPTPEPGWRTRAGYRTLVIERPDHWIVRQAGLAYDRYAYDFVDGTGTKHPGLIWPGGEYLEPAHPDAVVVARIAEGDRPLVGIGEFRNALVFSPTYWPAYWLWRHPHHPEVLDLFRAALS